MSNPDPAGVENHRLRCEVTAADRDAVAGLMEATGFFTAEEVTVAGELIDETLSTPSKSGYRFLFLESPTPEPAEPAGRPWRLEGYACFGPVSMTDSSWDLYWIAVDPARKRSGRGRLLLRSVEEAVAKLGGRRLFVETSGKPQYAPTRAFYEGLGYDKVAELEGFYAEGDSKVVFRRLVGAPGGGSGERRER